MFLLSVRRSRQIADALNRVHEQQLADIVIGLRLEEGPVPVVLARQLSQDMVLFLLAAAERGNVVVEMVARGNKDHVRGGFAQTGGFAHPGQEQETEESGADGIDLDCSFPGNSRRAR